MGIGAGIGERLKAVIRSRGIKQSWLADEAGVPVETVSRIVTGTVVNPGVLTIQKIAVALGLTVGELLGEAGPDVVTSLDRSKLEEIARELAARAEWLRSRFGGSAVRQSATAGGPRPEADRTDEPPEYPIMNK